MPGLIRDPLYRWHVAALSCGSPADKAQCLSQSVSHVDTRRVFSPLYVKPLTYLRSGNHVVPWRAKPRFKLDPMAPWPVLPRTLLCALSFASEATRGPMQQERVWRSVGKDHGIRHHQQNAATPS